jgi:NADH-quinone oxidoreductase subunit L
MVWFGLPRHAAAEHAVESPAVITVPLMILAGLSVVGGALDLPYLHSLNNWLGHTITAAAEGGTSAAWLQISWGGLNPFVALISTLLALLGFYLSWLMYGRTPVVAGQQDPLKKILGFVFTGMERKWYVDEIYAVLIVNRFADLSQFLAEVVDVRFWHDWFHERVLVGTYQWIARTVLNVRIDQQGIDAFFNGLGELIKRSSTSLRRLQNGFVRSYALAVLFGVVIIVGYLILK